MKILEIELENVKCYKNEKFNFENGINFINGLNGAGKTSIIESIGFCLFDYKIGKTGFTSYYIRRGEKKARVRVIFEDNENEKYIVERKISTTSNNSWIVKDIENEEEIVSGEEDVRNWIKQHIGLYKDDNLSDIYENIISVPQGMFTSAFLDSEKNRKAKFDPIFNLEIYRKVFLNTASLESGMKNKKMEIEKELEVSKTKIEMLKNEKQEYEKINKEMENNKKIENELTEKYEKINEIYQKELKIKESIKKHEDLQREKELKKLNIEEKIKLYEKQKERIELAKKALNDNKLGYQEYIKSQKIQKELQIKQKEYEKVKDDIRRIEKDIVSKSTFIAMKNENIEHSKKETEKLIIEIEKNLEDYNKNKSRIEKDLIKIEEKENDLRTFEEAQKNIIDLKNKINENILLIKTKKELLIEKSKLIDQEESLIKSKSELLQLLERKNEIENKIKILGENKVKIISTIEQLKESKKIAKTGICPYLKTECINVKGKTQEEYESEIIKLEYDLETLENEINKVDKKQKEILKAETMLQSAKEKLEENKNVKKQIQIITENISKLEEDNEKFNSNILDYLKRNQIKCIEELQEKMKILSTSFTELNKNYNIDKTRLENQKNNIENQKNKKTDFENNIQELNKTIKEALKEKSILENDKKEYINATKKYIGIENMIEENNINIEKNQEAYNMYIQNKNEVEKEAEITLNINNEKIKMKQLREEILDNENEIKKLEEVYNKKDMEENEQNLAKIKQDITKIQTIIETQKQRIDELIDKVKKLEQLLQDMEKQEKYYNKYELAIENISKIRQIIKQAPDDISEILIQKVSRKATQIYAKIANDNTRLEWREKYEVILIDNIGDTKIEKEFRQLSGGEQMSAALAIRIAMLEILTNVKIGILDEPTVNMDIERRQRLAEIIEDIGGFFTQLFIVSHDDTFNSVTENLIQLRTKET